MRQKNNIAADAAHLLRSEIDSTDFKNENSTTKKGKKSIFFLKEYSKRSWNRGDHQPK